MKQHRHIEHLLRLYFHDLPIVRRMAEEDVAYTKRELARVETLSPYRSLGTASYNPDAIHIPGSVSDSTAECVVAVQDKPEYRDIADKLLNTLAWLQQGLYEYDLLSQRVESVMTLLDPDLRMALGKMYSQGLRQCELPVSLSASTVSYHLTYAYACMDRFLRTRFYGMELAYLRSEHPQCFPGYRAGTVRHRQGGLVLAS
jgi:hypothetical protein